MDYKLGLATFTSITMINGVAWCVKYRLWGWDALEILAFAAVFGLAGGGIAMGLCWCIVRVIARLFPRFARRRQLSPPKTWS